MRVRLMVSPRRYRVCNHVARFVVNEVESLFLMCIQIRGAAMIKTRTRERAA